MSKAAVHVLGSHHASPAIARGHVARMIGGRATPEQCGVATLIVSELVTNAVMYGREPIQLSLRFDDDGLRVEVLDADADVAAVASPSRQCGSERASGRGLRIVDALARSWGVQANREGKCVWAAIAIGPTRSWLDVREIGVEQGSLK